MERELLDQEAGSGAGPEPQRLLCCPSAVPEWGLWGQLSWLLWLQEVINLLQTAF